MKVMCILACLLVTGCQYLPDFMRLEEEVLKVEYQKVEHKKVEDATAQG